MNAKRLVSIAATAILLLALAACTLSAATPPPTTPTTASGMGTLEAELGNIATQTAAAGGGTVPTLAVPEATQPAGGGETPGGGAAEPPAVGGGTPEGGQVTQEPAKPAKPAEFKPTPGLPATYTLQKGEFPFCIARRFNLNQSELLSLNGLGLNSVVPVGFTLRIPQTGNHFSGQRALQSHPTKYTVVAGDTIYNVACKYGDVDPNGIIAVNNLKSPYTLSAGEVLQIP